MGDYTRPKLLQPCPKAAPCAEEGVATLDTGIADSTCHAVAVVGMGCRLPGGNNSPEDLWQSILNKVDASGDIPAMRWEPYRHRDARNGRLLDQMNHRGYFLDQLEDFDAAFFQISPAEAEQMDPQQRITLEVTWEALENAGIAPQSLSGSNTAVFMGVNSDDYSKLILEDLPGIDAWMGIGTAYCGVANRISYHLNLMGPSSVVDAACASSLVAIDHARRAVLQGESTVAIAGGVNAICGPGLTRVLEQSGALSPQGCCRSFDEAAQGYGRGEGAAIIVLKNMANAVRDGDHILAILKGSAVAHDGYKNGIMTPNAKAQELVARNALWDAHIKPSTVDYIEAHATSTPLGDPTEVSALAAVYGSCRPAGQPCFIGSVKPNVGHLEAGAGAVGLIKAILSVQRGILPPQANLKILNSRMNWDQTGLRVVREAQEWPASDGPRRAAVCAYGYGGTVSHALVEEYINPGSFQGPGEPVPRNYQAILLSALQERRLFLQAETQKTWISTVGQQHHLGSIAATLATRREHHRYRAAFIATDHADVVEKLEAFIKGDPCDWTLSGQVQSIENESSKRVVWVFSGHGAQWLDMAKDLLHDPVFYNAVSPLERLVREELEFSPLQALESGEFGAADQIQVLTYLMHIGLHAVLQSKDVPCDAIIGHSVGEIAASVAAGCISAQEGALVVCRRAKLYRHFIGSGAMILVNMPGDKMEKELGSETQLALAIYASPSSCVVSGPTDEVQTLAATLEARGIKFFHVKSNIAFHHPQLRILSAPLRHALEGGLSPCPPKVALYTTSLLNPRSAPLRDSSYWVENMVNPVRLTSAVQAAAADGMRLFLEVSSHPIVAQSIEETMMHQGVANFTVTHTMARGKPAEKSILCSIAQLHCQGAAVDWKRAMGGVWAAEVPTTTWNHRPFWREVEARPLEDHRVTLDVDKHSLLGQRVSIAGENTTVYTTRIDEHVKPFPGSHPVHGAEIVPAAVLINTFLEGIAARTLSDITLRLPVLVSQPRDVQVIIKPDRFRICSLLVEPNASEQDEAWLTHTTGCWGGTVGRDSTPAGIDTKAVQLRIGTKLGDNFSVEYLHKVGVASMGFPWAITEHYGNLREMIAQVEVAPDLGSSPLPWDIHSWAPIMDAAISVGSTIFFDQPRLRMPAHIHRITVLTESAPPRRGVVYVDKVPDMTAAHVSICDDEGNVLVQLESLRYSEVEEAPGMDFSVDGLVHQLEWPPASYVETPLRLDHIVLISRDHERVEHYAAALKPEIGSILMLTGASQLSDLMETEEGCLTHHSAIVYVPGRLLPSDAIAIACQEYTCELLEIAKLVVNLSLPPKIFVLTDHVFTGKAAACLAQSVLCGLSRVIAAEHPDIWGGLIDLESSLFPLTTMKYVQGADVIRILDGVPRTARLRSLSQGNLLPRAQHNSLLPRPGGTYLITGGLGALGLQVAQFLAAKGARRLIIVSRSKLPPRSEWATCIAASSRFASALQKIRDLETQGVTICSLAVDIASSDAQSRLSIALNALSFPPVLGVIHAAGVLESELVLNTTPASMCRVLAPKVSGALTLHALFPPESLDFMILFSSCGPLFGLTGQASYGAGNAFLDTLATYRRRQGGHTVSFQWTSWRGMGMATSSELIDLELASNGITDIRNEEAFRAWTHASKFEIDHAVVLRSLSIEEGQMLPSPLLSDIVIRKESVSDSRSVGLVSSAESSSIATPKSASEHSTDMREHTQECVAQVLHLKADEVDCFEPLSNMGVDSVMSVRLRKRLQQTLALQIPPTLIWTCPTVEHIAQWLLQRA
ncbi:type I polyketide synthase [Aspergillus affinis]|uniref:type I polyketide synthase n=1 Tax=Aspergillus affinis TaxID=1070780 RepID=UPI0022FE3D32|nr:uncharacterized protein KD926_004493 [Aspergillus affinis]KAI9035124.1 hypothetical protein KD926_004493 [Aspergillus affinis]